MIVCSRCAMMSCVISRSSWRSDDWIKTGPTRAAFCDTKYAPPLSSPALTLTLTRARRRAIEDNVLRTCADLVRNCVAVGHLRPCVVLLVEADADAAQTAAAVLARTAPFNVRLLEHERVTDPAHVLVVPAGTLPRTSVRVC